MRVTKDGLNSYMNGFTLPKPSINGMCDYFQTPQYMQNSENECTMNFDIEMECASVANPLRYINQVVKQGTDIPVKLTEAYLYDSDTHSYS